MLEDLRVGAGIVVNFRGAQAKIQGQLSLSVEKKFQRRRFTYIVRLRLPPHRSPRTSRRHVELFFVRHTIFKFKVDTYADVDDDDVVVKRVKNDLVRGAEGAHGGQKNV